MQEKYIDKRSEERAIAGNADESSRVFFMEARVV